MTAILWFRRDLRLDDHPALAAAAASGPVLPVFIVGPVLLAEGAASRWRLQRALCALDDDLTARFGTRLTILHGPPAAVLPPLAARVGAREVHASSWPEAQRAASDRWTAEALEEAGARLVLHPGHTLLPPGRIRNATGGAFKVYSAFARAARAHGIPPPAALPALRFLPPRDGGPRACDLDLAPDMRRGAAVLAAHNPEVGEAAARARLASFLTGAVEDYATARDRPDLEATSALSDALATGEIGPRRIWAEAEAAGGASAAKFQSELLWRDFAWSLLTEAPTLPDAPFKPEWSAFPWRDDNPDAEAWRRGMTGEPLVDAGMRELFVTGRMHNRIRMVTASYLTKHLLTDWRVGLRWFADALTDWDPASNAMNWQWVAGCGPDAAPYFRIFNPALQAEKFDPDGSYRRRWLWGWQGSRAPEARAFFDAAPLSWGLSPDQPYPARAAVSLAEGRARALAALAAM